MLEDHVIILVLKGIYATDEELIREVMHFMGVQDRFPISRIEMRYDVP